MCDENATFTERVKAWLKEHEPTADQIQEAYTKMLTLLAKNPSQQGHDADTCLETLVNAYGQAGGEVDDLLSVDGQLKAEQSLSHPEHCALDPSPLYEVSDGPAEALPAPQKMELFKQLKRQFGAKAMTA
ncbi:hypothetical protein ACM7YY_10375 [Pseudomonas aeruginosa]